MKLNKQFTLNTIDKELLNEIEMLISKFEKNLSNINNKEFENLNTLITKTIDLRGKQINSIINSFCDKYPADILVGISFNFTLDFKTESIINRAIAVEQKYIALVTNQNADGGQK